jgi:hypothetical protein
MDFRQRRSCISKPTYRFFRSRISRDYKTANVVIAIDSVENVEAAAGEKKFLGAGEVRVGDLVWSRIKFDVVLNAETRKASKIVYKIEK